jgi:hypothetical protein
MLNEDYRDILHALSDEKVKFLLIGAFNNPLTIGKCGAVPFVGDSPIGFVSWDPRNHPEFVIVLKNFEYDPLYYFFPGRGPARGLTLPLAPSLSPPEAGEGWGY